MAAKSSISIIEIIVAILLPFAAVAIHEGFTTRFWICFLLTIFFFVPGMVYALYVITR